MRRPIVYLASPYGFSEQWKKRLLPEFVVALQSLNVDVWEPFARTGQEDMAKPGWAYRVAQRDLQDVREADALFAIVNGTPPDEGVMVEIGAAIALGKPTFLFRDDFRRCTDSEDYPLNLMVFAGLPEHEWQQSFYTSLDDVGNPKKALALWRASWES